MDAQPNDDASAADDGPDQRRAFAFFATTDLESAGPRVRRIKICGVIVDVAGR
jgi:hypothetical protein